MTGEPLTDPRTRDVIQDAVIEDVSMELTRARAKFNPFNSPHEGWAVIHEELDELWEHVRDNTGAGLSAYTEAIQVAAMALRYAIDCSNEASL